METTREMTAADITLQQLGGSRKLAVMIGAKEFFSDNNGAILSFKFASCKKANVVKITLNGSDLYDVKFIKRGQMNRKTFEVPVKTVAEFSDISVEQLKETFEDFTELFLSL